MKKRTAFTIEVSSIAIERANHTCECTCNKCLGNVGLSRHHRIPDSNANIAEYGVEVLKSERNCAILCQYCHDNCKHNFKELRDEE